MKLDRTCQPFSVEAVFISFLVNGKKLLGEYSNSKYQRQLKRFANDKEYREKVFDFLNERFTLNIKLEDK